MAAALLGGLALALYLPHVFKSGFYTDDWDLVARAHCQVDAAGTKHGIAAGLLGYPDPGGHQDRSTVLPYGALVAVDTHTGAAVHIPSLAACARALPRFLIP